MPEREADTRGQHTREQVQEIRVVVDQMISHGVDPSIVEKARHALEGRIESEVVLSTGEGERLVQWDSEERALAQVLNETRGSH